MSQCDNCQLQPGTDRPFPLSERREKAITEARRRWDGAPVTIKAMASAYVGPLLEALEAIGAELQAIQAHGVSHG